MRIKAFRVIRILIVMSVWCFAGVIVSADPGAGDAAKHLYKDFLIQQMMIVKIKEYNGDKDVGALKARLSREAKECGLYVPKWFTSRYSSVSVFQVNREEINQLVDQASKTYGISSDLIRAVIRAESGFKNEAISKAGAKGLMQLMDKTAKRIGVSDPFDPKANIFGGTRLLKNYLVKYRSVKKTLIAYNAGEKYVNHPYSKLPKETQSYIIKVITYYNTYKNKKI